MSTRTVNTKSAIFIVVIFLSTALFVLALGGCASTPPVTGPGSPDETQLQHYEMVVSAIATKSRVDALAALALLQADVYRWRRDTLTEASAMTDLSSLTHAVDREDWALANKKVLELKSKYRRP